MSTVMNNNDLNKYTIRDKVFSKVKGYSPWPAVVKDIENKTKMPKYNVKFDSTGEVAWVKN